MKTILTIALLMLMRVGVQAQTVYAGEQTIDKIKLPGLFLTIPIDVDKLYTTKPASS